jgi:hypothetical protein
MEHPGPEPVAEGKGTGQGGGNHGGGKKAAKSPSDASDASGGSRSKEAASKMSGSSRNRTTDPAEEEADATAGGDNASLKGSPGMHKLDASSGAKNFPSENEGSATAKNTSGKQESVEQHNEDFANKHDRSANKVEDHDDRVNKDFWAGMADPHHYSNSARSGFFLLPLPFGLVVGWGSGNWFQKKRIEEAIQKRIERDNFRVSIDSGDGHIFSDGVLG